MRAKAFFKTAFVVRPAVESAGDHWLGGTGAFQGGDCPVCKRPMLLLWDINCKDPVLRKASKGKFGALTRLPLYHCWRCSSELSYRVDEDHHVHIIQARYAQDAGPPLYDNYPDHFPRRPIALDASMPASLPKVVAKWDPDVDLLGERLSKNERRLLEQYFGHPIFIPRYMYHHQLGGEALYAAWEERAFQCPNKKCPGGLWDRVRKRGRYMKFLAGILNDPPGGLPMYEPLNEETRLSWNYLVSVYFQICDKCLTITTYGSGD
jgi:hypothetical protein